VENDYIDKDFTNEFSNFYSKTFRSRYGYCKRLHFFKESFDDIDDFIENFNSEKITYLGFLVKRPLNVGKVGRTLIVPKEIENFFYLCCIKREVHLLGKTIIAVGTPFIEQDSMVMTCAQATMWMFSKYMHFANALPRYLPYEITDKATNAFIQLSRAIPSNGLTTQQIMSGLSKMGYFPLLYTKPHKITCLEDKDLYKRDSLLWQPIETIYHYIESEIPVIILFREHAAIVIGHKIFDDTKELNLPEVVAEQNVLSSSFLTDAFIVHDDQEGIYRLLPCTEASRETLAKKHGGLLPREGSRYNDILSDVLEIIVPLPDKIYLSGEDVLTTINKILFNPDQGINFNLIDLLLESAKKGNKQAAELIYSLDNKYKNPVLIRTYCMKSSEFKKKIKSNSSINDEVKQDYLRTGMPRYIWVVEISTLSMFLETGKICGEIVFDSTSNQFDFIGSILTIHIPGCFHYHDSNHPERSKINDDVPEEETYIILNRNNTDKCYIVSEK